MKSVLGCLMCLVLTMSQSFAISGGPFGGRTKVSVTGTYAGVFHFSCHLCNNPNGSDCCQIQPGGGNSLAIFTLQIPKTGLATGTVAIFQFGETYTGTIQGTADPDTAKLNAEVSATFPIVAFAPDGSPVTGVATAAGQLQGRIKASNNNTFSTASVRIKGTADLQFSLRVNVPFDEIRYKVAGFKQAEGQ